MTTEADWYKDAVLYELYVRAFYDSNDDGHGDLQGVIAKLDYLKELGVDALWLLPIYPSPLKDDGYDITDFYGVHPDYGELTDFKTLIDEAHKRGLKVITDLVLNHTSSAHPWFEQSRAGKTNPKRDWYVWTDDPGRYAGTRIIFTDTESSNWTFDDISGAYYWHRFFSHQPDLNFDNPEVREEMKRVVRHWLELGIDGFRMDAIPYLFEREGTDNENLPETHAYLKELRTYIDSIRPDVFILGEVNQWPDDTLPYFGADGDEMSLLFHFPVMPRLYKALAEQNRRSVVDIMKRTPTIPEACQWAVFLRNHDELTLEMVTDEERAFMYDVYAPERAMRINLGIRRRLAPLMDGDERKIKLLNSLLMTLPGTPIIYYGDEIGMGDDVRLTDRNGVRTPMQWDNTLNAGFSAASDLYAPVIEREPFDYPRVNVAAQRANPASLLTWTKQLIKVRKQHRALGRGHFEIVEHPNETVLTFLNSHRDERGEDLLIALHNLSDRAQAVSLDLSAYRGRQLKDAFLQTVVAEADADTRLELASYAFLWLAA